MKVRLMAATVAAGMMIAVSARADDAKTIAEIVAGSKDHTILLKAVTEAGLVDTLKGKGPFTIFAPTDEAFKKLGDETIKKALADKDLLKKILLAHAVEGAVMAADVVKLDGKEVKTLQGTAFKVQVQGKNVTFGGAKVTKADVKASNGVIHVIDTVLMPK
ncbi:MAG: fasciclin domain-containing protein [Gemmataceae bacterium]|nr:fasciclin domain-containing protein [Gemmata sp.]MDW8198118.1 fasciclin domain-containing protein [Gemmataceae bacterium]